jgi:hypothetical protein
MMASLDGVEQRGLADEVHMMESCSAGLVQSRGASAVQISTMKMALWFDGGDGFSVNYMRCSSRIC